VLARQGKPREAREVLEIFERASQHRYVPPYAVGLVRAGLNEPDEVFASLDRAFFARDVHLMFLTVDPKWDPYRSDERFRLLLERCGFMRRPEQVASTRHSSSRRSGDI
jgi:hypothetical protein